MVITMESQKYKWEEVKKILVKRLKGTKHILTFGTIGSCNLEKDIDLIITKKKEASTKEFYLEVHSVFDCIDNYLNKKYNSGAFVFSSSTEQILFERFQKKGKIAFHTMIYTSLNQILKDWGWSLEEGLDIKKILLENYNCLIGETKDILKENFLQKTSLDHMFIFLYLYDRICSRLPNKLFVKIMQEHMEYLYKKRLGLKLPTIKTPKDAKKVFYELCDIIDKRA